jgi:hypothetical protein
MTPEEVWRRKSDEELLAASNRIGEYTALGQHVILAELQRRRELGLISDSVTAELSSDAGESRVSDRIVDPPQGVVVSLWRGDVPLRMTYWVCGVLTNLLWLVVIALAVATNFRPLVLLLVVLNLIYSVFIMVAIWRSAGRYAGNRIWADLARVSIVFGLIRAVSGLFLPG